MAATNSGRKEREEYQKAALLKARFETRITIAKCGKTCLDAGDYGGALKKFTEYLQIIMEVKRVRDIYSIRVQHFDSKKDLTELLMISHIFFEMARIYDTAPQFEEDSKKCLDQFVAFSANQPFQVINSEMIRKKLKKLSLRNADNFRNSYQQIFVQSKKCYIVTYCYHDEHPVTQDYRKFKAWLWNFSFGQEMIRNYYVFSSQFIEKWGQGHFAHLVGKFIIKPILHLFAKTVLPLIIK